jgi:hypothetical protein
MKRSLPVAGAFLLVCFGASALPRHAAQQESSTPTQAPADDYKITPEEMARKNPVKSSPEGLAEAIAPCATASMVTVRARLSNR